MFLEKDFNFISKVTTEQEREKTLQRLNDINYLVFEDNLSFEPKPRISHIEEVSIRSGSFYDTLKNVKAIYETEIAKNNSKGIIAGNRIQQIIIDQYRNNWELFKKAMKDMVKLYNSSTDIVDLCYKFYWDSQNGTKYFIS